MTGDFESLLPLPSHVSTVSDLIKVLQTLPSESLIYFSYSGKHLLAKHWSVGIFKGKDNNPFYGFVFDLPSEFFNRK